MVRVTTVVCMAITLCGAMIASAEAAIFRLTGSGTIRSVGPGLDGIGSPFEIGTPASFAVIFDASTPDANPSPESGDYLGAVAAFEVDLNGYEASAGAGNIFVGDFGAFGSDEVDFQSSGSVIGAEINGHSPAEINISFDGPTLANVFTSDLIPLSLLGDSSVWGDIALNSIFDVTGAPEGVVVDVESVSLMPIPLPAGLALLGSAILLLSFAAQRRRVSG